MESQYRDNQLESHWLNDLLKESQLKHVADISCGTAKHVLSLVSQNDAIELYATDASREMLRVAFEKLSGKSVGILQSDFLHLSFKPSSLDAVICMYWSIAGLDLDLTRELFREVNLALKKGGLFVFDTENSDGIKKDLIDFPFVDAFFQVSEGSVTRVNLSKLIETDVVDWKSYYLLESKGTTVLKTDEMKLRFYSRKQIERLLRETGFQARKVVSSVAGNYVQDSSTLYFVAEKN